MKALFSSAALFLIFAGVACQPRATPPAHTPPPTTSSELGTHLPTNTSAAPAPVTSDQPDDPGMTRAHDKTLIQEQPSGDESSRAAPNDGDAEPPQ